MSLTKYKDGYTVGGFIETTEKLFSSIESKQRNIRMVIQLYRVWLNKWVTPLRPPRMLFSSVESDKIECSSAPLSLAKQVGHSFESTENVVQLR